MGSWTPQLLEGFDMKYSGVKKYLGYHMAIYCGVVKVWLGVQLALQERSDTSDVKADLPTSLDFIKHNPFMTHLKLLRVKRMLAPLILTESSALKPVLRNLLCSRGNLRVTGVCSNCFTGTATCGRGANERVKRRKKRQGITPREQ